MEQAARPQLQPASAAERTRWSRERRKKGMRVVPFEVRDVEIEGLLACGPLAPAAREDRHEIARALGELIDKSHPRDGRAGGERRYGRALLRVTMLGS